MTTPAAVASGRYEIQEALGRGGMARVFLARDAQLGRLVAVKQLDDSLADNAEVRDRFVREAQLAARLNHPHVVAVFDAGEEDGCPYIVMEYVEGETLAGILKRRGRLGLDEAVDMAVQACAALQHAHDHGLVHRDVKPGNLLVRPDGTLKVADFGIARAAEATQVTELGTILGTAAYLAPEQAAGGETTAATDVYALAAVVYELLTGRPPYEFESLADLAQKHRAGEITPPSAIAPDVPRAVDRVLLGALATDAAARPRSAGDLAEELLSAAESEPRVTRAEAETVVVPPRRAGREVAARDSPARWPWLVFAALLLLVAGLGIALARAGDDEEPPPAAPQPTRVERVPPADDPEQQARNLSEWIRAHARDNPALEGAQPQDADQ